MRKAGSPFTETVVFVIEFDSACTKEGSRQTR